jgi:Bacterial pre-peptidase C-terminal domain
VNSNSGIRKTAITAAFLAAFGASGLAFAIYEIEPNAAIATAQRLEIGSGGSVEVTAAVGNSTGSIVGDVDFYVFEGREGDVVTIDIDGGMKLPGSGARSVDTVIAIFGQGGKKLRENDDAGYPLDPGSTHPYDSGITNFRLPASGAYTVGVSSYPRYFRDGGTQMSNTLNATSNGTYTLLISGVTPPLLQINVDVKPGNTDEAAPINPKSKGNIPVALLSSSDFNAPEVDEQSLRFGAQGDEASLLRCNKGDTDVNADGKRDLVCHFDTQTAGFEPGDLEGIVKGSLKDGRRFEGRGLLKVVPVKRQQ